MKASPCADEPRATARYEMIRDALREAMLDGRLAPGLVLVEAPLGQLFGTSRVPVRQALALLHEEGLIQRFDGRGYLVNPQRVELAPLRLPLSRKLLGLDPAEELIDVRPLGERILDELAKQVGNAIAFGHYRIDEQRACEYLGVSRHVIRETLMRLHDRGLVEKRPYAQWLAGPLTAQAITEDYELRALLEPEALRQGAAELPRETLLAMLERITTIQRRGNATGWEEIERLEQDLHVICLGRPRNLKMSKLIRQCQNPINIGRIFVEVLNAGIDPNTLVEHRLVMESLLHGTVDSAVINLRDHLQRARERTLKRIKVLSVLPDPDLPPYLERLS
ncbi:GntR family transcriptional regulator [Halotalea alkalilenta]|uniref:GntR family transcriptional regulator n=1 Tax=Halotalea alkalilenta TaxID=376489 RepID=UPI00047FE5F0|nr:GntR family transcriptional regulator [Halotalea alkalilenta]